MKFIPDSHARLWAISVFVFIAIFVCVICNMAIEREMTWLVYPVCSLIFAWGVFAPLIYRGKDGLLISLGLLSGLILPYLLVLEQWTHTPGWFIPIALPIAVFSVLFIWVIYGIVKRLRNPWHISAAIIAEGGILSLFTYLALSLGYSMFPWGWISFGSALGLSLLLLIAARIRKEAASNNNI
ncbi:MAG: hypothetical protein E7Z72_03500 [Methanocorpusculum parvum]|nr:hypothetical protein [Methanocorpusculum parvum]